MRCMGTFKQDRICDLCKVANRKTYCQCLNEYNLNKTKAEQRAAIREKCAYYSYLYDRDCYLYHACTKEIKDGDYIKCQPRPECLGE